MLLIDSFLYDGDPIVEERLRIMSPYVDYFYIVEASYSFSGNKKELHYLKNKHVFEPYKNKIRFVHIEEFPQVPIQWVREKITITSTYNEDFNSWWKEAYQRSIVFDRIRNDIGKQQYLLIAADVDEIVSPKLLQQIKEDYKTVHPEINMRPIFLTMFFYYYSWKWMKKEKEWTRPFIAVSNVLNRLFERSYSPTLLNDIRMEFQKEPSIARAGWHLSYFMNAATIAKKINHFSHTSLNQEKFKSIEWIQKCIDEGLDPFQRPSENCIPAKNIPYYMPDI